MSELVKYGFVYLWFDKKHKRYYVGSHWGNPNDGYICSSDNMWQNHRNRPQDFKRRILKRIYTNREDLLKEEQRWLDMIKPSEFGFRFYNKNAKVSGYWWVNEKTRNEISQKMKGNKHGAVPCSPEKAKRISEAKRKKFEEKRQAGLSCYDKPHGGWSKGRKQPIEEIEKRRQSNLNWWTTEAGLKRRELLRQNFLDNNPKRV